MTKIIKTPEHLAASGSEHGIQSAFFLALNMAQKFGVSAALNMESYASSALAKKHGSQPIPQLQHVFAIPNGEARRPSVAARLKAEGVKPGVPDVFVPIPSYGFHGLWIEFKRNEKLRLSHDQKKYQIFLTQHNYAHRICHDWSFALATVCAYLNVLDVDIADNVFKKGAVDIIGKE